MCEWLSSVEWCDVRLMCSGRSFSAHRAVLASVSEFLRKLFLSCPQEETLTFIFLPDFDLEALSSVLYYAYNGEVMIERPKLEKFLDVIKALQIYIDEPYFEKIRDSVGDRNLKLYTYRESQLPKNVFALPNEHSSDTKHEYINLRKGERLRDMWLQYSLSDSDEVDKPICRRWSDVQPSLDNPVAPYGDRQRNSLLRDLYIETYPQNGNVNGLASGVLAIPNERYRAPTSVLLPNANSKLHSRADDTLSEINKKTVALTSYIPNVVYERQTCIQDCRPYVESCSNRFQDFKSLSFTNTQIFVEQNYSYGSSNVRNPWLNIPISNSPIQIQQNHNTTNRVKIPSLDLSMSHMNIENNVIAQNLCTNAQKYLTTVNLLQGNLNKTIEKVPIDKKNMRRSLAKVPIFNQVLDSPWCPRLPNTYKPFRRKAYEVSDLPICSRKENTLSDSNNNVEQCSNVDICKKNAKLVQHAGEELKCAVCHQVFTSEECLNTHMKRHTTAARYSCGECGKTFSQLRNFKYHMSVHRGTREFAATCTVCGKYFNDRGYLSSHMKIHRNRKEYKCTLCPKSFNQRVAYNMHVRIHTGVKPHVCDECGKAFSRKMLLKQHQRTHSGERPYACPHCDKRFADRSNMTLHLRLHTGVKPFSCTLCPKSFTKKHHLKSHLNFHTGAKPYSCPRCKLAFTQSSNMRTHMKKCNDPHDASTPSS